ncbi:hypothetical protein IEQ34_017534 [Dendrobium chrysotoxum]|uniref:Uncharacterized protein n=1 Tax=Dendrobium chrysotoxum TaxID=161865 RepID=A0AAV7FU25_DENCH|nr:hypothetical protein IEQ34_017534 [Dendrobium chrysotoxum]
MYVSIIEFIKNKRFYGEIIGKLRQVNTPQGDRTLALGFPIKGISKPFLSLPPRRYLLGVRFLFKALGIEELRGGGKFKGASTTLSKSAKL